MKTINIYLSFKDYSIRDTQGGLYNISDAEKLYKNGKVKHYNWAFKKLIYFDFNFDKTKDFLKKEGMI